MSSSSDVAVIAPNLKRRLSGVTATVVRLVPVQAKEIDIRATGPGLPPSVPHIPLWRIPFLTRRTRVWHARRNVEMLLGLFLRNVLRMRLKLLFTSAAQRQHKPFTKKLIAKMDAVVATSPQAAAFLDRPATVIMHGIDVDTFRPSENMHATRRKLGLADGMLIGCSGRIRHQKGQDLLVEAAIPLLRSRTNVHVVFTGRATQENETYLSALREKIDAAGLGDRMRFIGEIPWDDMIAFYQSLDLFVAPARWEGFGLTPIEAMACGTPAIACRGVGAFDQQIKDGETGALIEKDNVSDLQRAFEALIDNPDRLAAMRPAARAHVVEKFSIAREAQALIAIYRDLLSDG
ncbi:glycosyltransferase family 4 protein [Celeribacter sp.]|uniref:glycosyltransferase family 4 protein n=1 Tax=Celeribacter sp. TaxID=1890673 RepID=UPI003A8E570F